MDQRHPDAVQVFHSGFEEATDKNVDFWPDGWTRKRGLNFPAYLPIKIVETEAPEGHFVLKIALNGGAAAAYSPPIDVGSLFSYVLEGRLRTENLKHSRGFITLSFYDAQGKLLETLESEKYQQTDAWTKVRLGPVTARGKELRSAVVGLHLEPIDDQFDLHGAGWFDDIWLARLPSMTLKTDRPENVYMMGTPIKINCAVSGIFERHPLMKCEVFDVLGNPVDASEHRIETRMPTSLSRSDSLLAGGRAEDQQGFLGTLDWIPRLKDAGFYRARVTLLGGSGKIMERELTLAVLDSRPWVLRGEFGWALPQRRPLPLTTIANLLPHLGIGWLKCPVWFGDKEIEQLDDFIDVVEQLSAEGIEVVGMLCDPPADARPQFGDDVNLTAAAIFSSEPELWYKSIEPIVTRLSLQVRWWQLGTDDDTSFVGYPDLNQRITGIKKQLQKFGQNVNLGFAWQIPIEMPTDKKPSWQFLSLVANPPLTSDELSHYLTTSNTPEISQWVVLEPLPQDQYTLTDRAADLVHRMIAAKRAAARAIILPDPFDPERGLFRGDGTPGELLLPWRTAASALAGSEYLGSLELPEGSENYVFARGEELVMVLWNARQVREKIYLGEDLRQVDVWGRSVVPPQDGEDQLIEVGPLPTFLLGLNQPIVRCNMALQFEHPQLPSVVGTAHANSALVKNFFPQGVAGQIRLHTPEDWQTLPRVLNFKLAAGEEIREPFSIRLPFDATNGKRQIRVDFEVTADRDYHFSAYRNLEVGTGDVLIEMGSHLNAKGELEVEQFFTNTTDEILNFKCFLYVPGRRRLVTQVTRLGPQRDTKRYRLPNGREFIGKAISLRAEEIGGQRTFNFRFIAEE